MQYFPIHSFQRNNIRGQLSDPIFAEKYQTPENWRQVTNEFQKATFLCLEAIFEKQIRIEHFPQAEFMNINYKIYYSLVSLAIADVHNFLLKFEHMGRNVIPPFFKTLSYER